MELNERIPINVLFSKSQKDSVKISPLGSYVAWRQRNQNGVMNICLCGTKEHLEGSDNSIRSLTDANDYDVCRRFWFTKDERNIIYLREAPLGSELYKLFSIDLETGENNCLILDPKTTCVEGFAGNVCIWFPEKTPRKVYFSSGTGSLFWSISVVDLDTGVVSLVERNPMSTYGGIAWFAIKLGLSYLLKALTCCLYSPPKPKIPVFQFPDKEMCFRVCACISVFPITIHWMAKKGNRWVEFERYGFSDANMQLIGSGGGDGTMRIEFVDETKLRTHTCFETDTTSYSEYDLETLERTDIFCDPQSDIEGFISDPQSREVQGFITNVEKPEVTFTKLGSSKIESDYKHLQDQIGTFYITSRTLNDNIWTVGTLSDISAPEYYMYIRDSKEILSLGSQKPQLCKYSLSSMTPMFISARDGEKILCYLTTPSRHDPDNGPPPMIAFPHGGPNARDDWGFNPIVQLLADRGIAVLNVNYRGSTGFGARFVQIGNQGSFCKEMMWDIEDAVREMCARGLADLNQIGILGGSFGGYATLWNMTLGPKDLWKCGVALSPLTTVGKANTETAFRGDALTKKYWDNIYGEVAFDLEKAKAASPLYHVENISKPMLLIHSDNDPRCPNKNTMEVVEAMKKQNVRGMYVEYSGEGHGLQKEENRLDCWSRVAEFLSNEFGVNEDKRIEISGNTGSVLWDGL